MRWWSWVSSSLVAVLAAGCPGGPTQLVVVVDTDLAIPAALDRVRVTVTAGADRMAFEEQTLATDELLPLTVAVIPEDDHLGPIDVVAQGYLRGAPVVSRRARVTLVQGESRMLRLDLLGSCVGVDCAMDESCGDQGCDDVEIPELPAWTGTAPRVIDAGMDAATPPRDGGGVDAGPRPDAMVPPDAGEPDAAVVTCEGDAECDDGVPCTADRCMDGRCVQLPDDSMCDDGNDCTDDRCTASGCAPTNNTSPCDDGLFCNGFDRCADGACTNHAGDPCDSPTVCDEDGMRCTGCRSEADCPAPTMGAWSACAYGDSCDETGTRMRTNRTYACTGGACVPTDTPESEPCTRTTAGNSCGVGSCGSYGACDYTDACDQSASRSRTCTDLACAGGVCRSSNRTETTPCSRTTTGTSCGATTCGSYGACDYSDACDQAANRTRTCMDFACASGTCRATSRDETMACSRTTTGDSCGSESCGTFGACDYSGTCDESASQSRTCTTPTCSGGSCTGSSMRTDTMACTRDTDGASCGMSRICSAGSCITCTPTLSGSFGMVGSTYFTAMSGSGNTLTFTTSMPTMGSVTASAPVTFSGSATTSSCIWQVLTPGGNTLQITDFSGATVGTINVTGAIVSGSGNPPCSPSPYGCFPPCLSRAVGGSGSLTLQYSDGSSSTLTFACP